ncbi:MAG: Exodeoxyribonuclease beta chain, partial [Candidatus Binatus sp.]|nr:Exodeoxyribonuclease beta chain [Candidatus Binatus sp.]
MSDLFYLRPRILDQIALDAHSVIEASAGTGKTYTIENLVVEILVKAKATIDKILVVTFTEKATSELRARIRGALEAALSGKCDPGSEYRTALDESMHDALREALFAFDRAPIHTIHAFCHRMLTELAFQSGTSFSVEIIDKQSAFHEAFRAELREHFAIDEAAQNLLGTWLAKDDIEKLERLLFDAHRLRYLATGDAARNEGAGDLALDIQVVDAFLPRVAKRLESIKRERGVLDYDDMLEWLARALDGRHGETLAASLRERYRYALIDEFQDTDDLQWKIFRRIFVDGGGGNTVHLIGDPKQAIYGFRGADVFAYGRACRELFKLGIKPVHLIENFRSTGKLIDAINLIFEQDADPAFFTGDIRYDQPVICGRKQLRAVDVGKKDVKPITLLRMTSSKLSASRVSFAIGRRIAATVRDLLREGPGQLFVNGKSGKIEPLQAREVFILTRSNIESVKIGNFLREATVP